MKNSHGKAIFLRTSLSEPHNTIDIPKDQQIERRIVLTEKNLVNIHAFDAASKEGIKIDNQNFITLTPNRTRPTDVHVYHVPIEGNLYALLHARHMLGIAAQCMQGRN